MVITSDSDLLLFDLGTSGSVVFLSDIDSTADESNDMTALVYSQDALCTKLALDPGRQGMLHFAFEIKMDPYRSLANCISRSKRQYSATTYASDYAEFISQYLLSQYLNVTSIGLGAPEYLKFLDPRISELIFGWTGNTALGALVQDTVYGDNAVIYLPVLLDRWDQASAWDPSTTIRQLAYSFCRTSQDTRSTVVEYRRTLSRASKGQAVELLEDEQVAEALGELLSLCTKTLNATAGSSQLRWAALCLCLEARHAADQGGESLAVKLWKRASKSKGKLDPGSWDAIHLTGQIQGTLYSLRILDQVLKCQIGSLSTSADLVGRVGKLLGHLSTLLPVAAFPVGLDMHTLFMRLQQAGALGHLADIAGLSGQFGSNEPGRRSKDRKQMGRLEQGKAKAPPSTNPFDILGGDW